MSSLSMDLLVKEKQGMHRVQYGHLGTRGSEVQISSKPPHRCQYNEKDGRILTYNTSDELIICNVSEDGAEEELCRMQMEALDFALSPSGRHLSTFCSPPMPNLATGEAAATTPNLHVWRLPQSKKEGGPVELAAFLHRKQTDWAPQWTADETFFARAVGNEVRFHRADDASRVAFKIQAEHLGGFSLSPGSAYPKAAIFVKESNGEPAAVKIFLLPNFQTPMASKHFFKADRIQMVWSPTGKHLLAVTHTDVDSTGQSYYGENSLYFLSGDGSFDCRVPLDKAGPVHEVTWGPRGDEFIIAYGYMPSRLALFNLKCEVAFLFPVESKNHVRYAPAGNLIAFGGFGNLPGYVEIWTRSGTMLKRVGSLQATGASICEWAPSGHCLITATVTPRLRVDNGYRIWSWTGEILEHKAIKELYQVAWRPRPADAFPRVDFSKSSAVMKSPEASAPAPKKEAYVPPAMRNRPGIFSLGLKPSAIRASPSEQQDITVALQKATISSGLTNREKNIRKLQKKLDQIRELKAKLSDGAQLEINQLDKIKSENEVAKELEAVMAQPDV